MRVVVIGSGLMGLTTAYFLRRAGCEVLVIDRRDSAARETSFANGGMLHASQANPWNEPGIAWRLLPMLLREDAAVKIRAYALPRLARWGWGFLANSRSVRYRRNLERNARLAHYSLRVMSELRDTVELDYDASSAGTLKIFRTVEEAQQAAALNDFFSQQNIAFETLASDAVVDLEPALAPVGDSISGGLYFPGDESGDAFKFCLSLQRICEADGVEFRFETTVLRLVREGDRLARIETEDRKIYADAFVVAAGSYSARLARQAGLRVPIAPIKGYSLTIPIGSWPAPPRIPVIDDHLHAAVCPLGDRLRVAGTAEVAGFNRVLTKSRVDNLFQLVKKLYPEATPYYSDAAADRWTGLRPMSVDGVGIMGATPVKNLFLNTGHGHLGWTMAAGAGKAVAAAAAATESEFDLGEYSLQRF